MNAKDIIGKNVVGLGGRNIGIVVDLIVYPTEWRIYALIVKVYKAAIKELKLKKPLFGLPVVEIPTSAIASVTDNVLLNASFDELVKIIQQHKK